MSDRYPIFPERIQTRDGIDYYYLCGDCGNLVKEAAKETHDGFHDSLTAFAEQTGDAFGHVYAADTGIVEALNELKDRVYSLEIACTPDVIGV